MKVHEFYDWGNLITPDQRFEMCKDISNLIAQGKYNKITNIFTHFESQ